MIELEKIMKSKFKRFNLSLPYLPLPLFLKRKIHKYHFGNDSIDKTSWIRRWSICATCRESRSCSTMTWTSWRCRWDANVRRGANEWPIGERPSTHNTARSRCGGAERAGRDRPSENRARVRTQCWPASSIRCANQVDPRPTDSATPARPPPLCDELSTMRNRSRFASRGSLSSRARLRATRSARKMSAPFWAIACRSRRCPTRPSTRVCARLVAW